MKKIYLFGIALFIFACASVQTSHKNDVPHPPVPKTIPHETAIHDTILVDEYYWMKDKTRTDPHVIEYLQKENEYADEIMAHTELLQQQLYNEMISRIQQSDISVPVLIDSFYYYWKSIEDEEYSIYCRKKNTPDAEEEYVLDMNDLASGYEYFDVAEISMSPNHRYVAFTSDTTGSEFFSMHVKDLHTGELLPDSNSPINDIVWAKDNKTLFYTKENEFGRSDRLYRHELGSPSEEDELIYFEDDNSFYVWIYASRNKDYIILTSGNEITYEIRFLPTNDPFDEFTLVQPREKDHRYYICPHEDELYVVSNDNAHNYKVMVTPIDNPGKENWKEFIPHRDTVAVDINVFKDYIVVYERVNALQKIRIIGLNAGEDYYIEFPEPIYSVYQGRNPNYDTDIFQYTYESMVTPYAIFDYNMETRKAEIRKQQQIPSGYDASQYNSERIFAPAPDGTKIPISLVYKKDLFKKDGSNPLLLYAYGSYGDTMDPYFSTSRLSLLDRGFVYAIAHVRGGGEYGDPWYDQGKVMNKKNTFTDFIACEEYLIQEDYTSSDKLVIEGASAGGLLIGAVLNMRPDLCEIAIAEVPFVDVIYTSLDTTLSAVVWHYDEFGNPNMKEEFDYMLSYCPYNNVKARNYPNIFTLAGFYDPRVNYWEPAKWIARIRDNKLDDNLMLLVTKFSGHTGASGKLEHVREVAFEFAFIFDILGIKFR